MRIFLSAYINFNLGDDLFLKIVTDRYSDKFICVSDNVYDFSHINLIFVNKYISKVINVLKNKFSIIFPYNFIVKKCQFILSVGGSMFIENKSRVGKLYFLNKPYYILGSNFGPYKTKQYYDKFHEIFSKAEDVCFREEYSYNLFKDLPNVRYASDIVFSLDTSNITITNNKKVVISVIDCEKKSNAEYKEYYESKIIDLIAYFVKKEYEIVLMSYCKAEGDEEAIESILSKINNIELKSKIKTYFYNGNIIEALNIMGDCQIVVGTRFHANILGLVLDKTIIPIAYSDKTLNVLNDLEFKGKIFDIREMNKFDINSLTDEDLKYKLDISFQKKDAEKHFEKLDRVLNRKEKNE